MNTTNIVFAIISVTIIAFNLHILYKSHKELKRSREELKRLKDTMLAELEENYKKAKVGLKDENK